VSDRESPLFRAPSGTDLARLASCALAYACFLIIPSAVDRPARGAGQIPAVKVAPHRTNDLDRWDLVCSACPGRRQTGRSGLYRPSHPTSSGATIIPEPECPRRRRLSSLGYEHYDVRPPGLRNSCASR
jgi:hypothetical protein